MLSGAFYHFLCREVGIRGRKRGGGAGGGEGRRGGDDRRERRAARKGRKEEGQRVGEGDGGDAPEALPIGNGSMNMHDDTSTHYLHGVSVISANVDSSYACVCTH